MSKTPSITLYTAPTANGLKISIFLELLGLPYTVVSMDLTTHSQKAASFTRKFPNGRIPALTDGGQHLFESGAILQYLASTYDVSHRFSYAADTPEYWDTQCWLFWQCAGLGPYTGQALHFLRYVTERGDFEYPVRRYQEETKRLLGVLEARLSGGEGWVVGDRITVADVAMLPWVSMAAFAGVQGVAEGKWPAVKEWVGRMKEVEGVKRGLEVPMPVDFGLLVENKEVMGMVVEMGKMWYVPTRHEEVLGVKL